jgi:glycosyltransferase involved in cell wall biosynthesis
LARRIELIMDIKVFWLRRRFGWMGKYSGYDRLCDEIACLSPGQYQSVWQKTGKVRNKWYRRFLKRLGANAKPSPMYTMESTAAEVEVLWKSLQQKPNLLHVTYVENHLGILPEWKQRLSFKIVGTAHQPAGWWRMVHPYPNSIAALDALIVPASREVAYFEQYLPGRVFFIPHGIDTDFFHPAESTQTKSPRCVFSGRHLRDIHTLAQVIDIIVKHNPNIGFDMIVPRESRDRSNADLIRIARHEQVCWHAGLSDEQLKKLYQQATMLVLPIIDCTANNALLEAIACGLPVISNDVGGLRDYTRDSFADLLPIGDVDGFVNAILRLAEDSQEQHNRSKMAREFAQTHLTWKQIAEQTKEVYQKVLSLI